MSFFSRFAQGKLPLNRIEAFSDGVFAIVVTLLVLELKVPHLPDPTNVQALAHALLELLPKFLSWLISFIIVCKYWLNHHHILAQAKYADYGMVWLNALFLMFQSFIPFPTALMGEYPMNPLAVTFFGCVFALNTFLFLLLQRHIVLKLLKAEAVEDQIPHVMRLAALGACCYLLGAALAWVNVYLAFALYIITPLFSITPPVKKKR